jgi:hypothetical protein
MNYIDKALHARIPGGSAAQDWFMPHEAPQAKENVRDVVGRMFDTIETPTEEMIDAARTFIMYTEFTPRTLESMRDHLNNCGTDYSYFPDWARHDCGHLTKSMIASIVWCMMFHAMKEEQ